MGHGKWYRWLWCIISVRHMIPLLRAHWSVWGTGLFCLRRAYGTVSESCHRSSKALSPSYCWTCSFQGLFHSGKLELDCIRYINIQTVDHVQWVPFISIVNFNRSTTMLKSYLITSMDGTLTLIWSNSLCSSSIMQYKRYHGNQCHVSHMTHDGRVELVREQLARESESDGGWSGVPCSISASKTTRYSAATSSQLWSRSGTRRTSRRSWCAANR